MLGKEIPRLIIAGEQSQGKGRFGRIWFAPKGNLYFTIIQPIKHPIEQIPVIVAVAAAEVLIRLLGNNSSISCHPDFDAYFPCHPDERQDPEKHKKQYVTSLLDPDVRQDDRGAVITLKPPNDVLVDGKKIGGILIEKWDPFYSIGIGINVASSPLIQAYETTCVHDYNRHVTNGFLLRCFLRRCDALLKEDFAFIQAAYNRLCTY